MDDWMVGKTLSIRLGRQTDEGCISCDYERVELSVSIFYNKPFYTHTNEFNVGVAE